MRRPRAVAGRLHPGVQIADAVVRFDRVDAARVYERLTGRRDQLWIGARSADDLAARVVANNLDSRPIKRLARGVLDLELGAPGAVLLVDLAREGAPVVVDDLIVEGAVVLYENSCLDAGGLGAPAEVNLRADRELLSDPVEGRDLRSAGDQSAARVLDIEVHGDGLTRMVGVILDERGDPRVLVTLAEARLENRPRRLGCRG